MKIFAQLRNVNASEGYCGDEEWEEIEVDSVAEAFKKFRRAFGRCTSNVYIDHDGVTKKIGWVFVKRCKYCDTDRKYLQEMWVTLHEKKPTSQHHYMEVGNVRKKI